MPAYSIFALGESLITVSDGGQLDGVTQGDGSHLVGRMITLASDAWQEVLISDNDSDFRDNDGNQRLDGAQDFDGVSYAGGTRVEAEFGLSLSDGTNTWQVVGFNLNNSNPSYGTIEGLAFVGGPGGFPPVGVPLTVLSAQEGPNFDQSEYATPICFAAGTMIRTARGPRPVGALRPGDRVWTRDNGPVPVRWAGQRTVIAAGRFRAVEIAPGRIGGTMPLCVSQQHRLLLRCSAAEMLFGTPEVFVPAIALIDAGLARFSPLRSVCYAHLLLDDHAVIDANGFEAESLFLHGRQAGSGPDALFFPELRDFGMRHMALARPGLSRREANLLLERCRIRPAPRCA